MQSFILCLFFGIFPICIHSRIVLDIYHDNSKANSGVSENVQTPNQTYDEISLTKYLNSEYYGLIKVGKPAKEFKVIFDTTWADSWLPSEHCALYELSCMWHTRYDSKKSSTYKEDGRKFEISNDEISLKGFLSVDDFHLPHLKVANQTFIEITHMPVMSTLLDKADGLIGLAFSSLAIDGTIPFFYNMIQQNIIKENIFTFYMNRDPTTSKAGNLILGGTDRSHIKTNLTYLPVIEKKYWTIRMDKIIVDVGNKSFSFCTNGCNAMIDTSSNAIVGPGNIIEKINDLIGAKSVWKFFAYKYMVDCRTFAKLPPITFVLGGKNFTIQSKYYVQHMTAFSATLCLSPFVRSNTDSKVWQLGGAFLMQFYTEYDLDRGRIGIAETLM
ncbi:hypothetical protein PV327_008672 [Microctonus hyperodae]|uniref:Peptidase A1 domain-containing protein n=1 Tax=Microctonus hyperodae TaxID=165561 RepID=A0AA39KHZ6_MICHY|nr:hypothetical protein PV327_008672 [Microctonus hyperodae]